MTKKTLPKYNSSTLTYKCGVCGAKIYPCEDYCNECYSEVDWDNYISHIDNPEQDEELFPLSEIGD